MQRRWLATLMIGVGLSVLAVFGDRTSLFDGLSADAQDLLQPGTESTGDVVMVGIDRASLADVGVGWPWPRSLHADLLDAIGAGSPAVVVYDVLFADERPADSSLADALDRTPTILASALTLQRTDEGPPRIVERVDPLDDLADSAVGVGHANVSVTERRGVVRAVPYVALTDRGVVEFSLAAATLAYLEGVEAAVERPNGVQIGEVFVPLDGGRLTVNWAEGLDDDEIVSAVDVFDGRVDSSRFAGKIVVVGVTEPTIGDLHLVPTDKSGNAAGLLIHANAVNTVAARAWLGPATAASQALLIAVAALVTAAAFARLPLVAAAAVAVAVLGGLVAWSAWRFTDDGVLVDIVWPALSVVASSVAMVVWRYRREFRHRRRAQALFGEYVPDNVLTRLGDPSMLDEVLDGERRRAVVLFCDLRGFTALAGALTPSDTRRMLEHYYDYVTVHIHQHGGSVIQFVGDEVFAAFGVPVDTGDAVTQALTAARALVDDVGALDERLSADGLPALRFGVGLHEGDVVAAHVGSHVHRQYAVIGETVNIGSRLCGEAGPGQVVSAADLSDGLDEGFGPRVERHLRGVATAVATRTYESAVAARSH